MTFNPEPFRIVRSRGEIPEADRRAWVMDQAEQANAAGAILCRVTHAETNPGILLFEAWSEYPTDQGAPRWAVADTHGEAL